jgi:hypothetical protein
VRTKESSGGSRHWRVGVFGVMLALLLSLTTGCSASFRARRATPTTTAYLRTIRHGDPTDHLTYMGSDARYHYVFHDQLFGGGTYAVPVGTWHPRCTFPLGSGQPWVLLHNDLPAKEH